MDKKQLEKEMRALEYGDEPLPGGVHDAAITVINGERDWTSRDGSRFVAYEKRSHLWDKEVKDFVDTLRSKGVDGFVYTNTSTAVMGNLAAFEKNGCRINGMAYDVDGRPGIVVNI